MHRKHPASPPAPHPASALWFAVPVMAGLVGALGWSRLRALQDASPASDPQLAVAVVAAGACFAVAGWWLGGLLMLGLASLARVFRWGPLERWASRLTPRLVARAAGALVGAQLAAMSPAHADDAVPDPFWGPAVSGTEQLAPGAGSSLPEAGTAPSGDAGAGDATPAGAPDAAHGGAGVDAEGKHAASPSAGHSEDPASTRAPAGPAAASHPAGGPGREAAASASESTGPAGPHARERVGDGALTVVAGDTLWDLTAQLLGPGATDEAVCSHLGSWLAHNTLAEHGDLIRPGDVLQVPPELLKAAGSTQ